MADVTKEELLAILKIAGAMKQNPWGFREVLQNKAAVILMQKESCRTLVSFDIGIQQLGGKVSIPPSSSVKMGKIEEGGREETKDVARTIAGYADFFVARVFGQHILEELAKYGGKPVINALSDWEHPCQAIGDFFTIKEKFGTFDNLHLAFVGDGNNVCHSLMIGAAILGIKMTVCCPQEYQPKNEIIDKSAKMGLDLSLIHDPTKVIGAHIVYTDVWASMGQKQEIEIREKIFRPFQVNSEFMSRQDSDAIFMHCLPAERGREVTDEVIESFQSIVFQQAGNRLHIQKAIMVLIMNPSSVNHLLK